MLFIDYETASAANLKATGAWAYSEHPSTRVLCAVLAFQRDRNAPRRVLRLNTNGSLALPGEVCDYLQNGGLICAHNATFERAIWTNVLRPARLWPVVAAFEQWEDTQALGHAVNLPSTLEGLAAVLGSPCLKDEEGAKLMREMCVAHPDEVNGGWIYDTDPVRIERLTDYCEGDVHATAEAFWRLPRLSAIEREVWLADQEINARGVFVDLGMAANMATVAAARSAELAAETFELSAAMIANATSTPALKKWITAQGVELPKVKKKNKEGVTRVVETLNAESVKKLLGNPSVPDQVLSVLRNRVEANKATSLAKLKTIPRMVCNDGRLRGMLHYCQADTGRWSSKGVQLHNLPKMKIENDEMALVLAMLNIASVDGLKFATKSPLAAISQGLRSLFIAPPGFDLIGGDYSAIEARVLAWLAGQEDSLAIFRTGGDIYVDTAHLIGSTVRQEGKVTELASGYGMGGLKFWWQANQWGVPLSLKDAVRINKKWRAAKTAIVAFWKELETAAHSAVLDPGREFAAGPILAVTKSKTLLLRLPSGRCLRYHHPQVVTVKKEFTVATEEGEIEVIEIESDTLQFLLCKDGTSMERTETYGGKLVENVTQAISRDLMALALTRFRKRPLFRGSPLYSIVLHVHDSGVAQVPAGAGDVEEFCSIMAELPPWATTLPNKVEGYRGQRFKG